MMLINPRINIEERQFSSKPRAAGKRTSNFIYLLTEVHNDTDICQKARYAPVKLAAATVLATAISRDGVVLMPA